MKYKILINKNHLNTQKRTIDKLSVKFDIRSLNTIEVSS